MKELIDEAPGECFDRGRLFRRQRCQARVHALQLTDSEFFRLLLQAHDRGSNIHGAATLVETLNLGSDEGFRVSGLPATFSHMRGRDLLQVVDVVDEDAFNLVDGRIDIAGHGNVDEEHRPVAAPMHEGLAVLAAEDRVRRASGADHDVGFARGLVEPVEWDYTAIERLSQRMGTFLGAIRDENSAGSLLDEMARRKLRHFSCAHKEYGAALERAKYLASKVDCHRSDGD